MKNKRLRESKVSVVPLVVLFIASLFFLVQYFTKSSVKTTGLTLLGESGFFQKEIFYIITGLIIIGIAIFLFIKNIKKKHR